MPPCSSAAQPPGRSRFIPCARPPATSKPNSPCSNSCRVSLPTRKRRTRSANISRPSAKPPAASATSTCSTRWSKTTPPRSPPPKTNATNNALRRDAKTLAKHLKLQRKQQTDRLTEVLGTEEKRLAKALSKLEVALEPAQALTVPATRLAASIERWFRAHTPRLPVLEPLDEDALHALRKASKLSRYMAESLPANLPTVPRLIQRYEQIQEFGGKWHDWLLLREMAAKHHGKRAALTERYSQHRDAALASYQSHLASLLATGRARVPHAKAAPSSSVGV